MRTDGNDENFRACCGMALRLTLCTRLLSSLLLDALVSLDCPVLMLRLYLVIAV